MRTKSHQTNLISSCDRETGFDDTEKQWISDTAASVRSLIPAYIIVKSKNRILLASGGDPQTQRSKAQDHVRIL